MEFDKSRLERLKRSLYSRDESNVPKEKRTPVSEVDYDVKNSWGNPPSFEMSAEAIAMKRKSNSFFNKFLLGSIIFFFLALGAAAFIFFGGLNMISSNNVDIKIVGPSTISSGEELDLNLSVVNQNRTSLEKVTLSIDYPTGTQSVDKSGTPLVRDKTDLGTIANGQSKDYSLRALMFGEKGATKTLKLRLEYTVTGSNAVFSKEKTYDVSISSSPLLLDVKYPIEINSGQDVTFSIDVTSNSSVAVQNALVKIEYPYGFTYKDSSIKPLSSGNNIWKVGDLKDGDKKTLTVTGTLVGQNMEDRSFRISLGTGSDASAKDFDTDLAVEQATVGIRKSFFDLSVSASNGDNNVATIGQSVPVTIGWQNTLPDKITNGNITVKLSGNVFDRTQVTAGSGGFYRSLDNTILWDKNTTGSLSDMSPGDSGQVAFSVTSLSNLVQIRSIKNPHIDVAVEMDGSRTGTEAGPVSSTQNMTIKFLSDLGLTAKSYYSAGSLTNTGPIPPRADIETTYTITWTLSNTVNDLTGTAVSATLPTGVVWKGEISPSSERVTYNPDQRTLLWSVGNVSSGTGFTYSPRTVSFKVGITPSVTQSGQILGLVSNILGVATDTYTQTTLHASAMDVNTRFSDPNFVTGQDTVTR